MKEFATLGGGCFWCLEAVYDQLYGVDSIVCGFSGGHVPNPTYEEVCSEKTGHAEVNQVTFDTDILSYQDILDIFFAIHDPTTPNRQGADMGTQFNSVIFTHTPEQHAIALQTIATLEKAGLWEDPILTEVHPYEAFYPAEDYHQQYYARNPDLGYCRVIIAPKVVTVRTKFAEKIKVLA